MEKTIFIAVGGTFGHICPALALHNKIVGKAQVAFIGVGLAKNAFFYQELPFYDVEGANFSHGFFRGAGKIIAGTLQSIKIFRKFRPHKVIGFGSFHSLPPLLAAKLLGIDLIVYEPNRTLGKVNKFCAFFAQSSYVAFEETKKNLRGSIHSIDLMMKQRMNFDQKMLKDKIGLDPDKNVLLFYGGSLGAKSINNLAIECVDKIPESLQIVVIAGEKDYPRMMQCKGLKVFSFYRPIEELLECTDMAISRAGAGTLFDLMSFAIPAIMIPYPKSIGEHQLHNAMYFQEKIGGGYCLEESNLAEFFPTLQKLLTHHDQLRRAIEEKGLQQEKSFIDEVLL